MRTLRTPDAVALLQWRRYSILVVSPLPVKRRADRELGRIEIEGLAELAALAQPLAGALGSADGLVPVHGDFAPWNCAPLWTRTLALWDWEEARLGLPLEDVFHWRLQRSLRWNMGTPAQLVRETLTPTDELRRICERLGADIDIAPAALRATIEYRLKIGPAVMPRENLDGLRAALTMLEQSGVGTAA